ncbi:uncharacterized protein [Linepithema humile]|uniref:uncharacterized protein isoform X1 n=1 Tax=Linepithema humile TaxID=83485 RepID=UPI00351E2587
MFNNVGQKNPTNQTIPDFSFMNINNFWQWPHYVHEPPYVISPYDVRSQIWVRNGSLPPNLPFPFPNSFLQTTASSPIYHMQSGIQNPSQHQTDMLKGVLNINRTSENNQSVPYQSFDDNKLQTGNLMQMLNITSYSEEPIYPTHHLVSEKKMDLSTTNPKFSHISQSLTQDFQMQEHNFQIVGSIMNQTDSELHRSDIANESQQKQFKMEEQNSSNQLLVHTKVKTANVAPVVSIKQSTTANIESCGINKSIVQQQNMPHTSIETNRNKQKFRHSPFKTQNFSKLNAFTQEKKEYYNMSRNHKDKYENSNPRRMYTLMSPEDFQAGKKSHWSDLEITGSVRNLSPHLWQMTHLTVLYMNDNSLQRLPPEIGRLVNLRILDLSSNKLRSLPAELGDLIYLRELLLNQNFLRVLPYELGKLFQLQVLGLQGNPLSKEVMTLYGNGEPAGTNKLLTYMLDNLQDATGHARMLRDPVSPSRNMSYDNRTWQKLFFQSCIRILTRLTACANVQTDLCS